MMLKIPDPIKYLHELGIENGRLYRGYRLALKAHIIGFDPNKLEFKILVPSQRLSRQRPVKTVTHTDLLALAKGIYAQTLGLVGKLPVEQQYYVITINPKEITCECPDTTYNKNPLCVHKIAAIIRLYLDYGREFVDRNYRSVIAKLASHYKFWRMLRRKQ